MSLINRPPTDIALSNAVVPEHQNIGSTIGTLSTTDPDDGTTFTYTLVSGTGSSDNASFSISGASLQNAAVLDFATQSSYSVRVRSTDPGGLFVEKAFSVTITQVTNPPLTLTFTANNNPGFLGIASGFTILATSSNSQTLNYTIDYGDSTPTANGSFASGTPLTVNHLYALSGSYTVKIIVNDGSSAQTSSILEIIPSPASGGMDVPNVAQGADPIASPIVAPLGGVSMAVAASNGGVIELMINTDTLTRNAYNLCTVFGDFNGNSPCVFGTTPVHAYTQHGIFVAHTMATNSATQQHAGEARLTLAISNAETGEHTLTGQNPAGNLLVPNAIDSTITKHSLTGKFQFKGNTQDIVSFHGSVTLGKGFDPSKTHDLWMGIGNIVVNATVNTKGTVVLPGTPSILRSAKLLTKVKKGTVSQGGEVANIYATYYMSEMVANGFNTEGISNQSTDLVKNKSRGRNIQVAILIDGIPYVTLYPVNFSISSGGSIGNISGRTSK